MKSYIDNDIYNIIKKYNIFICGGFVVDILLQRDYNDIDMYFYNNNIHDIK